MTTSRPLPGERVIYNTYDHVEEARYTLGIIVVLRREMRAMPYTTASFGINCYLFFAKKKKEREKKRKGKKNKISSLSHKSYLRKRLCHPGSAIINNIIPIRGHDHGEALLPIILPPACIPHYEIAKASA